MLSASRSGWKLTWVIHAAVKASRRSPWATPTTYRPLVRRRNRSSGVSDIGGPPAMVAVGVRCRKKTPFPVLGGRHVRPAASHWQGRESTQLLAKELGRFPATVSATELA